LLLQKSRAMVARASRGHCSAPSHSIENISTQLSTSPSPIISLPQLSYSIGAGIYPAFTKASVKFHVNVINAASVERANQLLARSNGKYAGMTIEDIILRDSDKTDEETRNLVDWLSDTWMHAFFWESISAQFTEPSLKLRNFFADEFGSFEKFHQTFLYHGEAIWGNGWLCLVETRGRPKIFISANSTTPLLTPLKSSPLLVLDVWEHAYLDDFGTNKEVLHTRATYSHSFSV